MNSASQTTRGFNIIFIHSSLDDAGLTPQQFRVLAHISRRAGDGQSWASNNTMASICRMDEKTVISSLEVLQSRKMIRSRKRPGMTTIWSVEPPGNWDLTFPAKLKSGRPFSDPTRTTTQPKQPPRTQPKQPPRYLTQTKGDEGNPLKGIKERESLFRNSEVTAEAIYAAYPRKVARPKAIAAIIAAVKRCKIDPVELFAKATEMGNVWAGATKEEMAYCPHPATWFNAERFNDDSSTWRIKKLPPGHPQPRQPIIEGTLW